MRPSINYIRVACLRFMKSKSNSCFYEKGVSCQFKVIKHKKKGKQILWDIKIFQKCCWAITEQNFCSRSSSLNSVPGNKDFLTVKFSPSHRAAPPGRSLFQRKPVPRAHARLRWRSGTRGGCWARSGQLASLQQIPLLGMSTFPKFLCGLMLALASAIWETNGCRAVAGRVQTAY